MKIKFLLSGMFILPLSFIFQLKVSIVVKEWQYSDGTHSLNNLRASSQSSFNGSSNLQLKTGRKLNITVMEGKDLAAKDKSGKFDPYIKLQYGKVSDIVSLMRLCTRIA